ncbi:hypothetical protein ABZV75_14910 [Streptomyces flaveolus]|uniref:hypothetical protein n=1 Tax=Streptomyces flaveolus TaxID=67297 RepID=UPI0033B8C0AB
MVEEGNTCRLRKLTKVGDDNAIIYVDQALMNVLKWQKERQDAKWERLGDLWVDHDLVFARDGFKLTWEVSRLLVTWLVTPQPWNARNPT